MILKFFELLFILLFLNSITTLGLANPSLKVDKIVVEKSKRTLKLYGYHKLLKTYKVALGFSPEGHKLQQGDGKTPEGKYKIIAKNHSQKFYKTLTVSYPNKADLKAAKAAKVDSGGDIMIHGLGKKYGYVGKLHTLHDWTLGCVAVTNEEIDEIFQAISVGVKIEILP